MREGGSGRRERWREEGREVGGRKKGEEGRREKGRLIQGTHFGKLKIRGFKVPKVPSYLKMTTDYEMVSGGPFQGPHLRKVNLPASVTLPSCPSSAQALYNHTNVTPRHAASPAQSLDPLFHSQFCASAEFWGIPFLSTYLG